MANLGTKIVIIIDNNISNGVYLYACCKELMPDSRIKWLRVCDEDLPTVPLKDIRYESVTDLADAAEKIERESSKGQDIIVFYNLKLGALQRSHASAIDSQITHALKKLVEQHERRVLINIHSTDMPTRKVAETIDPMFKHRSLEAKVICHHLITGASPQTIMGIVRETLNEWEDRYEKIKVGN